MFHINTSLGAISAAETIASSLRLLDEEKIILLEALRETIATDLACLPAHAKVVNNAISRILLDYDRHSTPGNPKAQKQGRKAKGIEDAPSVAAEGTEEGPEAPSGPTEGVERPAEDPRGNDRAEPDTEAAS